MKLSTEAALALIVSAPVALADTIHVPADQPSVQSAILAASDGDEVVVAPGTYVEMIDLLGKAIVVRSEDPLDPAVVAATVLDGAQLGPVVRCVRGEGPDTVLSGITIVNGLWSTGGGMIIDASSPTVSHVTFRDNEATMEGGGVFRTGPGTLSMTACRFENNSAPIGGGMSLTTSQGTIQSCDFVGNSAVDQGGAVIFRGSGASFVECTFKSNTSLQGDGGAVLMPAGLGVGIFRRCVFDGNSADMGNGGAVMSTGLSARAYSCTFTNNTAQRGAGLGTAYGAPFGVHHCTFWRNVASISGGGIQPSFPAFGSVAGSILWENQPDQVAGTVLIFHHNDVQGGFPGTAVIDADPMFADASGRLSPGSPCIDAGDGDGARSLGLLVDLDGRPRFIDDITTPDTGSGPAPVPDMGPYEAHSGGIAFDIRPAGCPNDLNPKSMGVLPVAIPGSSDLDVSRIDLDSLGLVRADGTPGLVPPILGLPGPKPVLDDVTRPSDSSACACSDDGPDGLDDLVLKFWTADIVANLDLTGASVGDTIAFTITGWLTDGTPFRATDCTLIVSPYDLDADGAITVVDLDLVLSRLGQYTYPGELGDVNHSSRIDSADVDLFRQALGVPKKVFRSRTKF